ncbi:MAG: serine hydrolase [Clostridium sp.]
MKSKGKKTKKTLTNILIASISLFSLLAISIFAFNFINKNNLSQDLANTSNSANSNANLQNNSTKKINLKTLTPEDFSYYETISDDERLLFLNMHEYSIEDRIRVYLNHDINNIGLIYYDIASKDKVSINPDKEFVAASTYKLTLCLLTNYLACNNELDLNEYIAFKEEYYADGTGVLCTLDTIGSYTIQELLDLSIIHSDNIATDMLSRRLGGKENVRSQVYKLLNIDYPSVENIITPNVEFEILSYLYENKDNVHFSHMIDTLTKTDFNDRLDKYIPTELVAHKIGNYYEYLHDVGFIFDKSPHVLIAYTQDLDDAKEKIAQISKALFIN